MATTNFPVKAAYRARLVVDSTAVTTSTDVIAFGGANSGIPGYIRTTADTFVSVPITYPGEDMFFNIIYDSPCTNSTLRYPAVAIQLRPTSFGGYNDSTGGSTAQSAFRYFLSTACFVATSTEAESFMLGPIDTDMFALSTSAGEQHLLMLVGYSTAKYGDATAISTLAAISTNAGSGWYHIKPMCVKPPF